MNLNTFEVELLDYYRSICPRYKALQERKDRKQQEIDRDIEAAGEEYMGDGLDVFFTDDTACDVGRKASV